MAHLERDARAESSVPPPARMRSGPVKRMHYVTGGPVSADGVYVSRPADRELLDHCLRGDFVYILTARQLGKSSLMYRTVEALQARDCKAVVLDLQAVVCNQGGLLRKCKPLPGAWWRRLCSPHAPP